MTPKVLIDECLNRANGIFLRLINQFNCSVEFSTEQYGRGTKDIDIDLYHQALIDKYDAIITYDGANKTPTDLSYIASEFYQSVKGYKLPGVIVLPMSNRAGEKPHSVACHTLRDNSLEIQTYLAQHPNGVLDIRRPTTLRLAG